MFLFLFNQINVLYLYQRKKQTLKKNIMKTLTNTTGTKEVRIKNQNGTFLCFFGQNYKGEFQVLDSKDYNSEKRAINWAKKQLL